MAVASISAQIADLLGEDPARPARLDVASAIARCPRLGVVPARDEHGRDVAIAVTASGKIYVVEDACPHDGSALSTGFVDGERLVCARHGWEFELATGQCPFRGACVDSKQWSPASGRSSVAGLTQSSE